jgi:hypothetical protein
MLQPFLADDLAAEILFGEPLSRSPECTANSPPAACPVRRTYQRALGLTTLRQRARFTFSGCSAPATATSAPKHHQLVCPTRRHFERQQSICRAAVEFCCQFNTKWPGLKILPMKLTAARLAANFVTVKNRTRSPLAKLLINGARELARSISEPTASRQARSCQRSSTSDQRSSTSEISLVFCCLLCRLLALKVVCCETAIRLELGAKRT